MDAADTPASVRGALKGLAVFAVLVGAPLVFSLAVYADSASPVARAPGSPANPGVNTPGSPTGLRDLRDPDWSTDPSDPFPMPPELANARLM